LFGDDFGLGRFLCGHVGILESLELS
jgi:hypothetical protein